jgi:SAM-dependent methyltransferase
VRDGGEGDGLLEAGVVERFHLFEIAEARVAQGVEGAERRGLSDRTVWYQEPADFSRPMRVNFVYWRGALHHMLDTEQAIVWSRESLVPGGTFYMNDFVGPTRFQWPDEMLEAANRVRRLLPDWMLGDKPRKLPRPHPDRLAAIDPTEAADSASILPAVRRYFPDAEVRPLGGVVYHLALKGVLENFGTEGDALLDALLLIDELYAKRGLTHYTLAVA